MELRNGGVLVHDPSRLEEDVADDCVLFEPYDEDDSSPSGSRCRRQGGEASPDRDRRARRRPRSSRFETASRRCPRNARAVEARRSRLRAPRPGHRRFARESSRTTAGSRCSERPPRAQRRAVEKEGLLQRTRGDRRSAERRCCRRDVEGNHLGAQLIRARSPRASGPRNAVSAVLGADIQIAEVADPRRLELRQRESGERLPASSATRADASRCTRASQPSLLSCGARSTSRYRRPCGSSVLAARVISQSATRRSSSGRAEGIDVRAPRRSVSDLEEVVEMLE